MNSLKTQYPPLSYLQSKPNNFSPFTHINSNRKMASSSHTSISPRGRAKKPTEVTCNPKYCNCGVHACALVSTTSENPNKLFWICRYKKCNFWQWAAKEDLEMHNSTSSYGLNLNEDVLKMNERLRCIEAKLKLVIVFICGLLIGLFMRK